MLGSLRQQHHASGATQYGKYDSDSDVDVAMCGGSMSGRGSMHIRPFIRARVVRRIGEFRYSEGC